MNKLLSVVVPCYNEEKNISCFYKKVSRILTTSNIPFEMVFVDDGSSDATLLQIKSVVEMADKYNPVRYVSFSRNFGKEAAIYAGLKYSKGDYVVLIDADLQHPPEMLPQMYNAITSYLKIYDCIACKRKSRKGEPKIRSLFSSMFYRVINKLSNIDMPQDSLDYRMMNRKMVDAIISISEKERFSKGIFSWVGFKTKWIPCVIKDRVVGESKWSFKSLIKYAISGITNYSNIMTSFCSFICLVLFLISIVLLIFGIVFSNNSIILSAVINFVGFMLSLMIKFISFYVMKIFNEIKERPIYVVKEDSDEEKF